MVTRVLSVILAVALGLSVAGTPASAQAIRVLVDGDAVGFDQPPVVVGGRVLVPLRGVFERLGAFVEWNRAQNTVVATREGTRVQLTIGNRQAWINGSPIPLDVPPMLVHGRTLVPLRFVSEAMGAFVDWNDATRTVLITSASAGPIPPPAAPSQPVPVPVPPPAPIDTSLRIGSLTHNASNALPEGATLIVTLRGTPGAVATFDIFGVADNIAMREVAPGVYEGTYAVRAKDTVIQGAVIGRLTRGGREVRAQTSSPVTIDAAPPEIMRRFPEAGQTVNNTRPNIIILFTDPGGSGLDPGRSRLFVNGADVSTSAEWTETAVRYNPPTAFDGEVRVRAVLVDRAGNVTRDRYEFTTTVSVGTLIRGVILNRTTLRGGETLQVTALGEPGSQATFQIEGVTAQLPMTESPGQPGAYVGTYLVRSRDEAADARVVVTLTRGRTTSRMAASARLSILAADHVPPPVVTFPRPGARVGNSITVRGTATPGHRVLVRVDYNGALVIFSVRGTLGQVATVADADGRWAVTMSRTAQLADSELTITATAVDEIGRQSEPTVVKVGGI